MGKFKKQTKKELVNVAEICRRWPKYQLDEVTKLFIHIKAQEDEIANLEKALGDLKRDVFFKNVDQLALPPPAPKPKEPVRKYSLPERLALMIQGSKEWDSTLRWNNLTPAQARELIAKFKAEV